MRFVIVIKVLLILQEIVENVINLANPQDIQLPTKVSLKRTFCFSLVISIFHKSMLLILSILYVFFQRFPYVRKYRFARASLFFNIS